MPAVSPLEGSADLVQVDVLINGAQIDSSQHLVSAVVVREINRPATAVLTYLYGDMPDGNKAHSKYFSKLAGAVLKVVANQHTIFEGTVARARPGASASNESAVRLECESSLAQLDGAPQSAFFIQKTDSDIVSQIVAELGLAAKVTSTSIQHPQVVQSNQSNLEFLLSRAERAGMCIVDEVAGISWQPLARSTAAAQYMVTYGQDIISYTNLASKPRWNTVHVQGWDLLRNEMIRASAPVPGATAGGELVIRRPVKTVAEAQAIATGYANRLELSRQEGYCSFQGAPLITLGSNLQLEGLGKFNGLYFVSKFTHDIRDGQFITECALGLSPEQLAVYETRTNQGPVIGVVTKLNDPDQQGRAKVQAPSLLDGELDWAPVVSPFGKHSMWMPEIGDSVMVAFLDNDISSPMIVGTLWGSKPPLPAEAYTGATVQRTISMGTDGPTLNLYSTGGVELTGAKGGDRVVLGGGTKGVPGVVLESKSGDTNVGAGTKLALTAPAALSVVTGQSSLTLDPGSLAINAHKIGATGLTVDLNSQSVMTIQATARLTLDASGGISLNKGALEVI